MPKGYLAFVLHAHLPFVRHPEYEEFLEEDWLFEAITETYIPLIQVFDGLIRDDIPFRLTLSLSPTLLSMLADPLLRQRYRRYLDRSEALARVMLEHHEDHDRGGFFFTSDDHEKLPARTRSMHDGALPAGAGRCRSPAFFDIRPITYPLASTTGEPLRPGMDGRNTTASLQDIPKQ